MTNNFSRRLSSISSIVLFIAMLQIAPIARASDTASLLVSCQDESLEFSSICLGFMAGIDETHSSMRQLLLSNSDPNKAIEMPENWPGFYCPPMELTPEQLRDVFVSYALSNPESQQWPAATTALVALSEILPCNN